MQAQLYNIDTALLSPRTVIRRFREGEGSALFHLIENNNYRINNLLPGTLDVVNNREAAEGYVREKIAAWLQQREFCFGVWDNKQAQLIGFIKIYHLDWRVPAADITFFIDREFEGKGIMTEVVQAVMRFAFSQLQIEKLRLRTSTENYPTQRLARKCAFRREGDLRSEIRRPSGELMDVMLFGYTKSEYEKV
jgi:RimJ/RimL family protein N-acetyltransferase